MPKPTRGHANARASLLKVDKCEAVRAPNAISRFASVLSAASFMKDWRYAAFAFLRVASWAGER